MCTIRAPQKARAKVRSRAVALWRVEKSQTPLVVAKWALYDGFSSFTVQEHQHARWLYEVKKFPRMPKPLGCPVIEGVPVLIETAVPGRPFTDELSMLQNADDARASETFRRMYGAAAEILEMIREPLKPAGAADILAEVEPYLQRVESVLGWDPDKTARVRAALEKYPSDPVPGSGETFLIGDFGPQNLLGDQSGVYLIDLEFSRKSLLAFIDPMAFVHGVFRKLVYPPAEKIGRGVAELFHERLFEGKTPLGKASREFLIGRGIPEKAHAWHWLVFFLHETAFQHFLNEVFPDSYRVVFGAWVDRAMTAVG